MPRRGERKYAGGKIQNAKSATAMGHPVFQLPDYKITQLPNFLAAETEVLAGENDPKDRLTGWHCGLRLRRRINLKIRNLGS